MTPYDIDGDFNIEPFDLIAWAAVFSDRETRRKMRREWNDWLATIPETPHPLGLE